MIYTRHRRAHPTLFTLLVLPIAKISSSIALQNRHKWENFTEPDKESVRDCMSIASTQAAIIIGAVITGAALQL